MTRSALGGEQAEEVGISRSKRSDVTAALPHFVIPETMTGAAVEDFVEIGVGDDDEPHSVTVCVVKTLPSCRTLVSLALQKRLHLDYEPRVIASILHANIVVLVLAT